MPVFKVTIERKVTTYDSVTRFIEAENEAAAEAAADKLADSYDGNCPDDAEESDKTSAELGEWYAGDVEAPDDDYDESDVIQANQV